ncbi:hypothetical protein GOBAR_AA07976 [Gossypium barbadense]|uniref:Uncharacterized protein n=1 Tax=Gossypium barbadense TaxID=3634 RepID=A0A2P5YAR6_GOSBA|nr:hypothetical protein GOBAR_AA07976 [Gossypium barbadense]
MENPEANHLPEVDSLPDGFVESPTDSLAPKTPILEQEKPLQSDYKEEDLVATEFGAGKGQKQRTFPFPLSEGDSFNGSLGSVDGKLECTEVKVDLEGEYQTVEGVSEATLTPLKETSSSESVNSLKDKKPETTETKRKNAKRTCKSEKEFLEFSLKYQQILAERDAAIAVRDKLESLCRELQRQKKMLMISLQICPLFLSFLFPGLGHLPCHQRYHVAKFQREGGRDECKRVWTEGQNLRLDLSARFQDAIKDVSNKLEEQKDECLSQLKENEMLRNKLKEFADQCALAEQQYAQKLKQKTLELQLANLKIKQHEEKLVEEQAQMKVYAEQVSQLLATEKNLRLQLTADGEKFQQFQVDEYNILFRVLESFVLDGLMDNPAVKGTYSPTFLRLEPFILAYIMPKLWHNNLVEGYNLSAIVDGKIVDDALFKSNEVFETFKQEIEKMAKSIKELKKENAFMKSKCEKSDVTLIELVEEREQMKKQLQKAKNQKDKLESLCRSLQAERKQGSATGNSSSEHPVTD